jgi:hypothetical protein
VNISFSFLQWSEIILICTFALSAFFLFSFALGAYAMQEHYDKNPWSVEIKRLKAERDLWRNAWKGVESEELTQFLKSRRAIARAMEERRAS